MLLIAGDQPLARRLDGLRIVEAAGAQAQQTIHVAPAQLVVAAHRDVGHDALALEEEGDDRPAVLGPRLDIDGAEHPGELEDAARLGDLRLAVTGSPGTSGSRARRPSRSIQASRLEVHAP